MRRDTQIAGIDVRVLLHESIGDALRIFFR